MEDSTVTVPSNNFSVKKKTHLSSFLFNHQVLKVHVFLFAFFNTKYEKSGLNGSKYYESALGIIFRLSMIS